MYLTDRAINKRLSEIRFEPSDGAEDFDASGQVQPCSVDLRLCSRFWRQKPKKLISLKKSTILELSPRRYWKQLDLKTGESIKLKPGEFVLARTCEEFSIPADCAGRLEGRSSFGRMGLIIHCTAGFINPGWRGRMPLALVNLGKHVIEIIPYVPICQVAFVELNETPERQYGESVLSSKYMNDDGGPSYWWRDPRIESLQKTLAQFDLPTAIQNEIVELAAVRDVDMIERLEKFIQKGRVGSVTNATDVLDGFARSELRQSHWHRVKHAVGRLSLCGMLLSIVWFSLRYALDGSTRAWYVAASAGALFLAASLWGIYTFFHLRETIDFLTPERLAAIERKEKKPPEFGPCRQN